MKKLFYTSVVLAVVAASLLACGRDMRALKRNSSGAAPSNRVNGNLQLPTEVAQAAMGLSGQNFGYLVTANPQDQDFRSNQLRTEIAGLQLKSQNVGNNTFNITVDLAEHACRNRASFRATVTSLQLGNRNQAIDLGTNNNYRVQMTCIPSPAAGGSLCLSYLLAITKQYTATSAGTVMTVVAFNQATNTYESAATTERFKYYVVVPPYVKVCSSGTGNTVNIPLFPGNGSGGGTNPAPGGGDFQNPPSTGGGGYSEPYTPPASPPSSGYQDWEYNTGSIFEDFPSSDYEDLGIVPADPSGDISLNPFIIDYDLGTSSNGGDVSLNPFVGTSSPAPGAPFETEPVGDDDDFFFF